jgi:hypothetical protein
VSTRRKKKEHLTPKMIWICIRVLGEVRGRCHANTPRSVASVFIRTVCTYCNVVRTRRGTAARYVTHTLHSTRSNNSFQNERNCSVFSHFSSTTSVENVEEGGSILFSPIPLENPFLSFALFLTPSFFTFIYF